MSRYTVRQDFASGLWEVQDNILHVVVATFLREREAVAYSLRAYLRGVA